MYNIWEILAIFIILFVRTCKLALVLLLIQGLVYNLTFHKINLYKIINKICYKLIKM